MGLRRAAAVCTAKIVARICRILGKQGVTWAGKIALAIDPQILSELASQVREKIFVVCGTNGKTTTNNLLCSALEAQGKRVVCNHTGSNMLNGCVAAFVLSASLSGKLNADYACIEVDEASALRIFPYFKPDFMILTNLFRDQLDRYGEIDITMDLVRDAMKLAPDMTIIVNADDALSVFVAMESGNPYVTYGIGEKVFEESINEIKEGRFCKKCGAKMNYHFYHFSQLGDYYCSACDFKRPGIKYDARSIETGDHLAFSVEGRRIRANYRGFYNIYNILACYAAGREAGLSLDNFQKVLDHYNPENGRMEHFSIGGTEIILNLAKNPVGFNQNISAVMEDASLKDLIILINDNDQDGTDVSWLWDVDFDRFQAANINSITVSGIRCQDMRLRLKYVDISSELEPDVEKAILDRIENGCGNLYVLVNYTGLYSTHNILKKLEKEKGRSKKAETRSDREQKNKVSLNAGKNFGDHKKLTIGHLYPDFLNLYGDRGNIQCLVKRCQWRGIDAEVTAIENDDSIDFSKLDIVLLGGGSDREQMLVCRKLLTIREDFKAYVEDGGVVIAVCGGYQLLGNYYATENGMIEGLGLIDMDTAQGKGYRLIDNIVLESELFSMPVVGFENHGGRTDIKNSRPLGRVVYGSGNDGQSGYEGVVYKNVIGTYIHGPLLPKNPEVADHLIRKALERKYKEEIALSPLPDVEEKEANAYIYNRFKDKVSRPQDQEQLV